MKLRSLVDKASELVKNNLSGEPNFTSPEIISEKLGEYESRFKDIETFKDVSLKNPKLSDFSNRRLLALGATGGAAAGGAIGTLKGLSDLGQDQITLKTATEIKPVLTPKLTGYSDELVPITKQYPVYDSDGNIVSYTSEVIKYSHKFTANMTDEKIGEQKITSGSLEHSNSGIPWVEGLRYAVIGAGIGTVGAAGVILMRKITGQDGLGLPGPVGSSKNDAKIIAGAGIAGTVLGGGAGYLSSAVEKSHAAVNFSVTNKVPLYEDKAVGQIPADHDHAASTYVQCPHSKVDVVRNVPAVKSILGIKSIQFEENTQTLSAQPRFSEAKAITSGMFLGGLLGVASGVFLTILNKVV